MPGTQFQTSDITTISQQSKVLFEVKSHLKTTIIDLSDIRTIEYLDIHNYLGNDYETLKDNFPYKDKNYLIFVLYKDNKHTPFFFVDEKSLLKEFNRIKRKLKHFGLIIG